MSYRLLEAYTTHWAALVCDDRRAKRSGDSKPDPPNEHGLFHALSLALSKIFPYSKVDNADDDQPAMYQVLAHLTAQDRSIAFSAIAEGMKTREGGERSISAS